MTYGATKIKKGWEYRGIAIVRTPSIAYSKTYWVVLGDFFDTLKAAKSFVDYRLDEKEGDAK